MFIQLYGGADVSGVELGNSQRLGHQRCILVGQIGILRTETALDRGVNQNYGRGVPQNQILAGRIGVNQLFEVGND